VGLDGNTWLMTPAVKGGVLFVSLVTEFGEMCVVSFTCCMMIE